MSPLPDEVHRLRSASLTLVFQVFECCCHCRINNHMVNCLLTLLLRCFHLRTRLEEVVACQMLLGWFMFRLKSAPCIPEWSPQ